MFNCNHKTVQDEKTAWVHTLTLCENKDDQVYNLAHQEIIDHIWSQRKQKWLSRTAVVVEKDLFGLLVAMA